MINQLIEFLTHLIIAVIGAGGYWGVFLLMMLESALIPIPSEVTMPFAGYLATLGKFNFWALVCVGASANLVGSWLAYALGRWGQEHVVRIVIRKYGKWLLVSEAEFDRSETWFRKYGEKIVFFSRILPVVRTFISLPAGIAEMNFWKFTYLTFIGSFIWSWILTYIGFALGKNWNSIEGIYRKLEYVIVFAVVAATIYYVFHKIKKLKR